MELDEWGSTAAAAVALSGGQQGSCQAGPHHCGHAVGGSLQIVVLVAFTPVLAGIAIGSSSADYFGLILFCIVGASMVGVGAPEGAFTPRGGIRTKRLTPCGI